MNTSKRIYRSMPYGGRMLLYSAHGLRQRLKKYSGPYFSMLAHLREAQWFPTSVLLDRSARAATEFAQAVIGTTPFYADSEAYRDWTGERVEDLPILEKDTVRGNLEALQPPTGEWFLRWTRTSGSTGTPLKFPITFECYQKAQAFRALHYEWSGVSLHGRDRLAICSGHPVVPPGTSRAPWWVRDLANNWYLLSSYHLFPETSADYVRLLERAQPKLLGGYPSALSLLARAYQAHGRRKIALKGIYVSSETLLESQRAVIEEAFQVKVYNRYGSAERSANIIECEKGGLHVQHELGHVEVVDSAGRPSEPGAEGRVVCTGFLNPAFPLIRYEIGDVVRLSERTDCACGRGGVLVDSIVGRTGDYIVNQDGRLYSTAGLTQPFTLTANIIEGQVYQPAVNRVVLRVVRAPRYSEADERQLLAEARRRLGPEMHIELEYLARIPRGANGKYKLVLSDVSPGQNAVAK